MLTLVKSDDPILRKKTDEVDLSALSDETTYLELLQIFESMLQTMHANNGVGLAANQVGISKRIFVYDTGEEDGRGVLVNPVVEEATSDFCVYQEGCLSLPGIVAEVGRPSKIVVTGYSIIDNAMGLTKVRIHAGGLLSRVFQHEIDHLDGILFTDRALKGTIRRQDDEAAKA